MRRRTAAFLATALAMVALAFQGVDSSPGRDPTTNPRTWGTPVRAERPDAPTIRTLTAAEYAVDGGNLRLNPELVGLIVDATATERYLYISLERVPLGAQAPPDHPWPGPYAIVRWAGGTEAVELVQWTWPGQVERWQLRERSGRVFAFAGDCVAVLG